MSSAPIRVPLIGASSLVLAALLYGFFGILTRTSGFDIPLFFLSWVRDLVGAVLILGPLIWLGKFKTMSLPDLGWMVLRTGTGVISFFSSYYAFYYLPIGTAYFIFFGGTTISSFLLGKFLFQETLNRLKIVSLFLALIGLCLVYTISINPEQFGYIWLAFGSGLAAACWNTLAKKVSDTYSATQLNGVDFLIFGLMTLVVSLIKQEAWSWPDLSAPWLANLGFLVIFILAGQLVLYGFKHLDAQRGSLIMLLEIVFGVILSNWFYQESLSFWNLIGGGLIVAAAALPEVGEVIKLFFQPKLRNTQLIDRAINKKSALG